MHVAITYLEMHNFAGEVNVRKFNSCVNPINKQIKFDLKNLANWSNANKIFFNFSKIELALFDRDLKVKLNGKRLYESDSVKYLGIQIEKFTLAWKQKINQDAVKLNKVDPAVSKFRGQSSMQNFNLIYTILVVFGYKTLIKLKGFTSQRKNFSG